MSSKSLSNYIQLIKKLKKDGEGDEGDKNQVETVEVRYFFEKDFKPINDEMIYGLSCILGDEKVFDLSKKYDYQLES